MQLYDITGRQIMTAVLNYSRTGVICVIIVLVFHHSYLFIMHQHVYGCIVRYCCGWSVCLFVRPPSVCLSHAGIVLKQMHVIVKHFTPSGSGMTLVFLSLPPLEFPKGSPSAGALNTWGRNLQFLIEIAIYLTNCTR